jgi:hypothetical protein
MLSPSPSAWQASAYSAMAATSSPGLGAEFSPAGLYRVPRSKTIIGWIVLEDGSQVGVQTRGTTLAAMLQLDPENPQGHC